MTEILQGKNVSLVFMANDVKGTHCSAGTGVDM